MEKLRKDNDDLLADVETVLEWAEEVKAMGRNVEQDFYRLFHDVDNENRLFEPGTENTDNCDVSTLNYSLSMKIVNSQATPMCMCIQETVSRSSPRVHVA